jgi:hypothetical protein
MRRITSDWLDSRVSSLNMLLERPMSRFDSNNGSNVGHLTFDKNDAGYMLVEIVSPAGGEGQWSTRMAPKAMDQFIDGIVRGISLRNAHIGVILLKNEVEMVGLTPDAALYDTANAALLHSTKDGV